MIALELTPLQFDPVARVSRRRLTRRKSISDPRQLWLWRSALTHYDLPVLQLGSIDNHDCKRLIASVLFDGLRDAACAIVRGAMDDDDIEWVLAWDDEPFGFVWCCDRLGLDEDTVRDHWVRNPKRWSKFGRGRSRGR